jgi:hypothetical protein
MRAVAMDADYTPIARYEHVMPGASLTWAQGVFACLLPFRLSMEDPNSGYFTMTLQGHGWRTLLALVPAVSFYWYAVYRRKKGRFVTIDGLIVLFTGLYGLAAVLLLPHEQEEALTKR